MCTSEHLILSLNIHEDFSSKSHILFSLAYYIRSILLHQITSINCIHIQITHVTDSRLTIHVKEAISERQANLEYIFPKIKLHGNNYFYPKLR